ncbi:MAG: DNA-binding protein WhiA [Oscillospiraceae bacterium]|nr:DNA-binding protein WhiA [Oscillospiraceae bacterium]
MSFSFETKQELCRVPVQKLCCARAEAYGILLYCNTFQYGEVRIITENQSFAARLPRLFHRAFRLRFDTLPDFSAPGKYVFRFDAPEKLRHIIGILGYDPRQTPILHINFALLEDDCCRAAFLRGVFFAGGSVTDPRKRYHLELLTSHAQVGRELQALLRDLEYQSKTLQRNGAFITYFKQSGQIADFLRLIGAPDAAGRLLDTKDEKRLRNSVNRRLNCDTANVDKSVEASREQAEAIRKLRDSGQLELLSDKLQLTAALRLEYPELSLSELAEEFDPPVTKSCLNHRLRKLTELAGIENTEKDV